jgi:hypothetical protein
VSTVVYKRLLARVERLTPGEWTDLTATATPALCCASCGSVFELPEMNRVEADGLIVPAVRCPSDPCGVFGYVRLEDWEQTVVG